MYFNTFLYNSVYASASEEAMAGSMAPTTAISRMVALSAIAAVLTTFVMGTLSDKMKNRKLFISVGYILWGLVTAVFGFITKDNIASVLGITDEAKILTGTVWAIIIMDIIMTYMGSTSNDAAFNAWCATFIKEMVDNGTLEEGDYAMFWRDSIILHNRNGDKYSGATKSDIAYNTDIDVVDSFNQLYDYLPSVNRVNIYSSDIRFCQSEAYDIYDELIYTFDGSEPDMSEKAAQMFTYYEYYEPLNISENWYLVSMKTEW